MYKRYKPELDYSYTLGVFPTVELLKYRPDVVEEIFVHSSAVDTAGVEELASLAAKHQKQLTVRDKQIAALSLKENVHAIAILHKYSMQLSPNSNHVALVQPADLGNLGTIMRTMLGFGLLNLALVSPAADVFNPRALRASMGAAFALNTVYYDSFADYITAFPNQHVYPFMLGGSTELAEWQPKLPCTLVFGNESSGLSAEFKDVGEPVYIAHSDKIDSLNLSIAVGVSLWAISTRGGVTHPQK